MKRKLAMKKKYVKLKRLKVLSERDRPKAELEDLTKIKSGSLAHHIRYLKSFLPSKMLMENLA